MFQRHILVNHSDENKRVVFSEFGYNDNDNSQEDVANYLEKAFLFARDRFQWLGTIYWFRLVEPDPNTTSTENPAGFGLFDLNWTWKSAATAYRNIPEFPSFLILSLIMIVTLPAVIAHRRRKVRCEAKISGTP
jgi:hypothetical protein